MELEIDDGGERDSVAKALMGIGTKNAEHIYISRKQNPYLFSQEDDLNLPEGQYRKALFAKWYQVLFMVENDTVYLDAVVDGRMEIKQPN